MEHLCTLLGDPQRAYPVVHLTGTNGKGSTARMVTALLAVHGLEVGTYTSPHLEAINERMTVDSVPIDDDDLAAGLLALAPFETELGVRLTHFELLTAAAFTWFADVAVDVAVVEVGMGGRWDATNVADGVVAVVTNVGLDHAEVIGPTRREIAREKAGIVKPEATLVLGETSPELAPLFTERSPSGLWRRCVEFDCDRNLPAHGGRLVDIRTPTGTYSDIWLPLYGPHQGDNAAVALAAAEAFFERRLDQDVVVQAFERVRVPGRFEIMQRHPLVVLDGAHNPDGARALTRTLVEDFGGVHPGILIVGFTAGRDPTEMLTLLDAGKAREVIACRPTHPRGLDAQDVADAARALGCAAVTAASVRAAIQRALEAAGAEDFVLVTGSLYVVGEARAALRLLRG